MSYDIHDEPENYVECIICHTRDDKDLMIEREETEIITPDNEEIKEINYYCQNCAHKSGISTD
ncbi:TPA: hypothetical protein JBI22_02255 [Legionella pneumophila]|nr:hypothetical protein [Legionella pneumophila]